MDEVLDEEKIRNFRQEKYYNLRWSDEERLFRKERKYLEDIFFEYSFPFSTAISIKLQNSVFGKYLDSYNLKQYQDKILNENKLAITEWDVKKFNSSELHKFEKQNSVIQNYLEILKSAVSKCDVVTLHCIHQRIPQLTLINFYVNLIDDDLRKFFNVTVLVLSGNNLRTLEGCTLPRKLTFLELFNNYISTVQDLVCDAPKTISHLGLARNKLDDHSLLHLLAHSGNFKRLKILDVCCNDICDLEFTLFGFEELESLTSLGLEGNPCAMLPFYKDVVLLYKPGLIFLDNVQILKNDRVFQDDDKKDRKAQLLFVCHRIMGLPKPPKDKKYNKAVQTIHLEVDLPLLEEVHFPEPEPDEEDDTNVSSKKGSAKTDKSKPSSERTSKKSSKKKSPYEWPDEYDPLAEKNNFSYKSVPKPWNKAIQYPPVFIESPEQNLTCIRDTFRSVVNVRAVYLKILPAKAQKKEKKKKEPKKDKKKGKQGDKSESGEKSKPAAPQDITLKRVTLGSFYCDLRTVNWSDETVDFYWADHPKIGSKALLMDGCLKALKYTDKPPKKKAPKKGKSGTEEIVVEEDPASIKNLYPKMLTCQVGFGLKRSFSV